MQIGCKFSFYPEASKVKINWLAYQVGECGVCVCMFVPTSVYVRHVYWPAIDETSCCAC